HFFTEFGGSVSQCSKRSTNSRMGLYHERKVHTSGATSPASFGDSRASSKPGPSKHLWLPLRPGGNLREAGQICPGGASLSASIEQQRTFSGIRTPRCCN